jgi:hypothetical protein
MEPPHVTSPTMCISRYVLSLCDVCEGATGSDGTVRRREGTTGAAWSSTQPSTELSSAPANQNHSRFGALLYIMN